MKDIKFSTHTNKKKIRNYNTNSFLNENTNSDINFSSIGLSQANEIINKNTGSSFKKNFKPNENYFSGTIFKNYSRLLSSSKVKNDKLKNKRKSKKNVI